MSAQLGIDFGARRRDAGHADALTHHAVELIRLTLTEVSERRVTFTSDDVLDALPQGTRDSLDVHPNVLGAVFRAAALGNTIEDTGAMVRTRSPKGRKRRIVVWRRR